MIYESDIQVHHKRYLSEEEWMALLQALEELYPNYAEAYKDILKNRIFITIILYWLRKMLWTIIVIGCSVYCLGSRK